MVGRLSCWCLSIVFHCLPFFFFFEPTNLTAQILFVPGVLHERKTTTEFWTISIWRTRPCGNEENAASRSCISANLFNLWIGQLSALVWWICSILMGFSLPEFGLTIYGNGAHTRYLRPPVDFFIERFS